MATQGRGGRRPGAGAKAKPSAARRRKRVMLSLTHGEYVLLRRAAGRRPLAVFAREILLSQLR